MASTPNNDTDGPLLDEIFTSGGYDDASGVYWDGVEEDSTDATNNTFCATGVGGGVDPSCSPGESSSATSSQGKTTTGVDKSKFIGKTVGEAEHAVAANVSREVARMVGGVTEEKTKGKGQKDKKPYDVQVAKANGKGNHDIEVKSMAVGSKQAISVHEDALLRKVEHSQANPGNTFHTVVVDERATHDNGSNKDNYSGNRIYYKRGSGRYSLSTMHPVKDEAELKKLINTPDSKLPESARGSLPTDKTELDNLRKAAAQASESRTVRDKARKERNKDKLREQARARAAKAKAEKNDNKESE